MPSSAKITPYMAKGPRAARAQKALLESEDRDTEGMKIAPGIISQWLRRNRLRIFSYRV